MKFEGSIEINQSRDKVVALFRDVDHLANWQEGFEKRETIKGSGDDVDSVNNLFYSFKDQKMELTETILSNNLPDSFEAFYHHKHMDNTMKCTFTAIEEDKTLYRSEVEYTRINWFLPRMMAIMFPGVYRKQARKWMLNFKQLSEDE